MYDPSGQSKAAEALKKAKEDILKPPSPPTN
jgi:hypothetical protein